MRRGTIALLSVVLLFGAAPYLTALERVRLNRTDDAIQVIGKGWTLKYGLAGTFKSAPNVDEAQLVEFRAGRAYFSHGQCLRLIDTDKGLVLGRWLLPGIITKIVPRDGSGRADITLSEPSSREGVTTADVLTFDPNDAKSLPVVFHENMLENLLPIREVKLYDKGPIGADGARELIPESQEAARRDPCSPWLQISLGRLLQEAGAPGAEVAFRRALDADVSYTEFLPMSGYLERAGMERLADEAFERGYKGFLENGNDPRLLTSLLPRLVLYSVDWKRVAPQRRRIIAERIYQLAPYMEASDLAWTHYSRAATNPAEKELWVARAEEARTRTSHTFSQFGVSFDRAVIVAFGVGTAWWGFIIVCFLQYWRQSRSDCTRLKTVHPLPRAGSRLSRLRARLRFFHVQYWSMPQRIGFILISVVGWFCYGWMLQSIAPVLLQGEAPIAISSGSLGKPTVRGFLSTRLSAMPERDFLIALSFQQSGDLANAAELYKRLPQYAESWNNLGVIWRVQGNESGATRAFQRALGMHPGLAEASLNLGRPPSDYWTSLHQKYVPGSPMIALPPQQVWRDAFAGGSRFSRLKRAALGPLRPWAIDFRSFTMAQHPTNVSMVIETVIRFAVLLAVLLLVMPVTPVEKSPGPFGKILCTLFPGTARPWGYVGGLVLIAWICLVQMIAMTARFGSPYLITMIATPNLMGTYGIESPFSETLSLVNPRPMWVITIAVALFVINAFVVFPVMRGWRPKFFHPGERPGPEPQVQQ